MTSIVPVFIILIALLQRAPPDPRFTAYLDSPGTSTVEWQSDRRLCLYYQGAPDRCYAAGRNVVTFGHEGSLSGEMRPALGGVYTLADPASGAIWRAELRRRAVYLAAIRR